MTKKSRRISSNLTVTDQRIVYSAYNDVSLERKEIPVANVVSVAGNYAKNPILGAIIKLIFGILSCCVLIGIFFKGFGVKMIRDAIDTIKGCNFELTLITNLFTGLQFEVNASRGILKLAKNKFKISVDRNVAKEILDEIGALVTESKMAKEAKAA